MIPKIIKKAEKTTKKELDKRFQTYLDLLSNNQYLFSKPQKPFDYSRFINLKL